MPIPVFRREETSQKESEETTIEEKPEEKQPERVIDGNFWAYSRCLLSVLFPGKTGRWGEGGF